MLHNNVFAPDYSVPLFSADSHQDPVPNSALVKGLDTAKKKVCIECG